MNTKLPLHLRLILHLGGSTVADASPPKGPRGWASGLLGHGASTTTRVRFPGRRHLVGAHVWLGQ